MADSPDKIPERYSVGPAGPEDAEQIRQLIHDSWIKTISEAIRVAPEKLEPVFDMTDEALERQWREPLAHSPEGRTTFVAKDGAEVLGVCTLQLRADEKGSNELMVIHVKQDKTTSGIGSALWRAAEKVLDPEKDTFLWTTVGTNAVEVYRRWGFEPVEYATEALRTKEPLSRERVKMIRKADIENRGEWISPKAGEDEIHR